MRAQSTKVSWGLIEKHKEHILSKQNALCKMGVKVKQQKKLTT